MMLDALNAPNIESHRRTRHGAAQGFLADLTGQCISLQSFHIMTTAQFNDCPLPSTEVDDEMNRYAEIGAFIEAAKSTLREVVFEHGPDIEYFSTVRHPHFIRHGQNPEPPLHMDQHFDTYILPVLVSGPWPKLGKLTVRGMGHWKPIDAWREDATTEEVNWLHNKTVGFRSKASMIWDAAPAECKVVVTDEASRPFYRFQDDKTVNGKGDRWWVR
jgi:hypothetical protein